MKKRAVCNNQVQALCENLWFWVDRRGEVDWESGHWGWVEPPMTTEEEDSLEWVGEVVIEE